MNKSLSRSRTSTSRRTPSKPFQTTTCTSHRSVQRVSFLKPPEHSLPRIPFGQTRPRRPRNIIDQLLGATEGTDTLCEIDWDDEEEDR